jgi:hypothetical protein
MHLWPIIIGAWQSYLKLIFLVLNTNNASQALSIPSNMSLFNQLITQDLFNQIQAYQRPSYWRNFCPKEAVFWKNRFSQDVVPQLDKGYRLVEFSFDMDGKYGPCPNCYHYGLCGSNALGVTTDHISHEEFRKLSTSKLWNQEQYQGLRKTLYGRYAVNKWVDEPNKLTLQLRRSREKICVV